MTTLDKIFAVAFTISALITVYAFFGVAGFAVLGAVIAGAGFMFLLAYLNEKTGGLLGWLFALFAIFG